jgi:predicted nucleic acid-binding Zn ribbon protein
LGCEKIIDRHWKLKKKKKKKKKMMMMMMMLWVMMLSVFPALIGVC